MDGAIWFERKRRVLLMGVMIHRGQQARSRGLVRVLSVCP